MSAGLCIASIFFLSLSDNSVCRAVFSVLPVELGGEPSLDDHINACCSYIIYFYDGFGTRAAVQQWHPPRTYIYRLASLLSLPKSSRRVTETRLGVGVVRFKFRLAMVELRSSNISWNQKSEEQLSLITHWVVQVWKKNVSSMHAIYYNILHAGSSP